MSTRARIVIVALLAAVIALVSCGSALAVSRYAGNYRSVGYGVKGEVGTPASRPTVYDIVCSWVSTCGPDWVQTGWAIQPGWSYPKSYVESSVDSSYDLDWYSDQSYNYARTYEVIYLGAGTGDQWRALIQGTSRGSWGPISAPREVQAFSEVLNNWSSQLKATFNNIQYKGQYQYFNFNEDHRYADSPYYLEWFYNYKYNTHGNGM